MTDIHSVEEALLHPERFRVSIFGSARIQKEGHEYQQVFNLAKSLNEETCEIIELAYQEFKIAGDKVCLNINKYQP